MDRLANNYAIIDIEGIALDKWRCEPAKGVFSNIHNCVRKVAIELWDSRARSFQFSPCLKMVDLTAQERRSFEYCRRQIHHLDYDPKRKQCASAAGEIFLEHFLNFWLQ